MKLLQMLFFFLFIRPLIFIIIGLNIQGKERLPLKGPAIIAPNHNSHLDTLSLLSIWPLMTISQLRPVAAADYFLQNSVMAWFSLNVMRIIPIDRREVKKGSDPLAQCSEALSRGEILVLFPEGSRGNPEQMMRFKSGISRLAQRHPEVPIIPVFMHGFGKSLPRDDFLLVPFFCDLLVGNRLYWQGSVSATMHAYQNSMHTLADQCHRPTWE